MRNLYLLILFLEWSFGILQVQALNDGQYGQRSDRVIAKENNLEVLTNSMDATRGAEHLQWAKKLYQVALEKKDEYHKEEALREIMAYYVNKDIKDTARYYIAEAERSLQDSPYKEHLLAFMKTIMDVRVVYYTDGAEADSLTTEVLVRLKTKKDASTLEKISDYYLLGVIAGRRADTGDVEKSKEVVAYLDEVLMLTEDLPVRIGMLFRPNSFYMICGNCLQEADRVNYALRYLDMLNKYKASLKEKKRYLMNQRHFLNAYGMLACSSNILGKEKAAEYYRGFVKLNHDYPEDASFTPTYEYLFTSYNYYLTLGNYDKVVNICDSLIAHFAELKKDEYALPFALEKVNYCDSLHRYKEAYLAYKAYDELKEKVKSYTEANDARETAINQKVDELIIEKQALEAQKSRMQVFLLLTLFVLAVCTIFYIIFFLRKTKGLNRRLLDANNQLIAAGERLKESEKMKYAFLRNLCNEILAPLNAIKGFSDFLIDNKVEEKESVAFLKIISDNSGQINRTLDDIQEIARLDTCDGSLPLDWTNIHTLCMREVDDVRRNAPHEKVEYVLEGDPENDTVRTNQTYFSYVLGHLLNRINQITEEGRIVVSYRLEPEKNVASVLIAGTGNVSAAGAASVGANDDVTWLVCKMIAERMNAHLWKDEEFKEGLRFIFELPQ